MQGSSAQSAQSVTTPPRAVHLEQGVEFAPARSSLVPRLLQGVLLGAVLITGLAWISRRRAEKELDERR